MTIRLDAARARSLHDRMRGAVLLPGDDGYDDARRVWNGRFDPRPAAVVRCESAADVAAAIAVARDQGLPLSVRGGGHGYAGHGVEDGALALHLGAMRAVRVDPERRRAVVGPGATWGDFDRAAQVHGLATTGGTVSSVGVAGYTLGGGTGWLARRHGLGLDNLVAAEVVTAAGRVLRASEDEHADLFWALRGGSGNFGVVTALEFRLHRVGPEVTVAQAFHPMARARDVLRFYREFAEQAPDEVAVYAFALRVPPAEPFPDEFRGEPAIALVACHCGEVAGGEAALAPLRDFGTPLVAALQAMPYVAVQQAFDAGTPKGLRWYSRAHYLDALSDEAIEVMAGCVEQLPGAFTMAYLEREGGAIARVDPAATAFPHRAARYALHVLPGWSDPADDDALMRWARAFHDAMAPSANGGVYVNLLARDESSRVPAAYGGNYARLAELKARWDPANVFRANHNIPPRG